MYDSNHFHSLIHLNLCISWVRRTHEGRQRLLVSLFARWLTHWAVCHKLY